MMRTSLLAALCLALLVGVVASPTAQASGRDRDRDDDQAQPDPTLSLDEAVAQAERRHDARVVRAEVKRRDDRVVYRIRLLDSSGRVFEVTVDAKTGEEY